MALGNITHVNHLLADMHCTPYLLHGFCLSHPRSCAGILSQFVYKVTKYERGAKLTTTDATEAGTRIPPKIKEPN